MSETRRSADELDKAVAGLPRELHPRGDLWPGIAGRLEPRPAPAAGSAWWRLAAAVAMVAAGLAAATLLRPGQSAPAAVRAAVAEGEGAAIAAAARRQRDGVLHAHRDLIGAATWRGGQLDPAGAAAVAAGVAELNRATAEIAAALDRDPGNRRLELALASSYRRESGWAARFGRVGPVS